MMKRQRPYDLAALIAVCAVYFVFAWLVDNSYYQHVLTLVAIFAVLGLSWNVLGGYTGVVSFGHAAFFGAGAFTVTLLMTGWSLTPWIGIPAGILVAAAAAIIIGVPTLRLRGVHFALAILAYPIVLRYVFDWLRYQEVMLPRMAQDATWFMQFNDVRAYALLAGVLLFLCLLISYKIERSRFGLELLAIKQNEQAAAASGIDVWNRKIVACAISGAIAGAAGGLYVVVIRVAVPADVFGLHISAQAMVVTLFGGVGTLWGPLIGAAVLIPLGDFLHAVLGQTIPGVQNIIYGVALIVAVLVAPEGLFWYARDKLAGWRQRTVAPSTPTLPIAGKHAESDHPGSIRTAAAGVPLLTVRSIGKSFRGLRAVSDVSFEVPEGIVLGIIGQNGAGKTTLFNLLSGFIKPDAGTVQFLGRDITGLSPTDISRLGIGRTFQVPRPFLRLSVFENVVVGAISTQPDNEAAAASARAAIAAVGLTCDPDTPASQLNAVELRLLELARTLAGSPRLVLLDEIFAGLSRTELALLLDVIRRLPSLGTTVMIIEHTMHAMMEICDRLLVLDHGVAIATGAPRDVIAEPAVVEAYLGRKWMADHAAA